MQINVKSYEVIIRSKKIGVIKHTSEGYKFYKNNNNRGSKNYPTIEAILNYIESIDL